MQESRKNKIFSGTVDQEVAICLTFATSNVPHVQIVSDMTNYYLGQLLVEAPAACQPAQNETKSHVIVTDIF